MEVNTTRQWLLVIAWTLSNMALSWTFDVHISSTDAVGQVVFNAALGIGWKYKLDPFRSSYVGKRLLALDASGGLVRLQERAACNTLGGHNPVTVYIEARTDSPNSHTNYTLTPLNLHIHGDGCFIKYKRKSRRDVWQTQIVGVHVGLSFGQCYRTGQIILNLDNFLPSTVRKCYYIVRIQDNSNGFAVSQTSENQLCLTTTRTVCMHRPYLVAGLALDVLCDSRRRAFDIPVKIILHGKAPAVRPVHHHHFSAKRATQSRLKRAAGANRPPSFSRTDYVKTIPEEQNPGYVVDTITAVDPDTGEAGTVIYTLVATRDGRSQNMFRINANTGQILTTHKLDREFIQTHYFQITATDNGSPPKSATAYLTIHVEDVNDHSPRFESSLYAREVSESIPIGHTVLTVRASDQDSGTNSEIRYSILNPGEPNNFFQIDPELGSIYTSKKLDRETHAFYQLSIQAQDQGSMTQRKSGTTTVEITVSDENDNKPKFAQKSYTFEVSENIDPTGNPVIAEIKATDLDSGSNGMIRYSITSGNAQGIFKIDPISGKLSVLSPLDYEKMKTYSLMIRAQDDGQPPRSDSTNVLIRVRDVNDNAPWFYSTSFEESVREDVDVGYTIFTVKAFDYDSRPNADLKYSIKDAPTGMPIKVDPESGTLSTTAKLDRETAERYEFKVEANDQGDPPKSTAVTFIVIIRDVNDNAPIFNPRVYRQVVSEEDPPGTLVVTVTAKDSDEKENARVYYEIKSGDDRGDFNIITQNGQGLIQVARNLNYKEKSRYVLTIRASDPGKLEDTATVFINVSDANTYRPIFVNTPYSTSVDENALIGHTVFKVHATDGDVGENARITYSINNNDQFQMNPNTGELSVRKSLDRETKHIYTIMVTATDHGRPAKTDSTDLEIIVNDINDNAPEFLKPVYIGQIKEDAIVGTSVIQVTAIDKDEGKNRWVRYTFEGGSSGNGDFRIAPVSGIVRTAKPLDRERLAKYELKAFAVDRGTPEKSSSVVIKIDILDVNDNAPMFGAKEINVYIRENSPIGTTVDRISATDPDDGENAEIEYSISGGADANSFELVTRPNEPAILVTNTELDYEGGKKEYTILIRARSGYRFSDVTVKVRVQDVNDNRPQLKDFTIIFNNYPDHFPVTPIGRIPAYDPDVDDKLLYKFTSGNEANLLHLDENTGYIRMNSRLNSDVPTNGTFQVIVSDSINEVKATCRLFVRLVTEDMLQNSITIRLSDLTQTLFLSPVYDLFVNALATIIPTTKDNIFIINVQDDTDVNSKILNVSFSAREKIEKNKDVFYSTQFLRERVYLQRLLLIRLSTLKVLPFDDNLCLIEPCLNYAECLAYLRFGNASNFLASQTMLFRPIQPVNRVKCSCPKGFTGRKKQYMCDIEMNLCYSSPCGNNGQCVRREGGYTCLCNPGYAGQNCEVDMRKTKYKTCPANMCKHGSKCVTLIKGGFRCEKCPTNDLGSQACKACQELPDRNAFCELKSRGFPKGSFLMFPSLKKRHRFKIRLEFATMQKSGLLFYNGRYNEEHDFIALEIVNGQVQFSFSLGSNITRVTAFKDGGVNDGNWQEITIEYLNRTATLSIGDCDTEISIKHGKSIPNYNCAAQETQVLDDNCAIITEQCHRFLDLTGPFQVGGIPSTSSNIQIENQDFDGCIRNIYIDDEFLDLDSFVYDNGTIEGCPPKESFCRSSPCKNQGTCHEAWGTYSCECKELYAGKDCSQRIGKPYRLLGTGFLLYDSGLPGVRLPWYSGISFRTRQMNGMLMYIQISNNNQINIELVEGYIHFIHTRKSLSLDQAQVNDGKWHYLESRWKPTNELELILDYGQYVVKGQMGEWIRGSNIDKVYVGGVVQIEGSRQVIKKGLKGCVENMRVGNSQNAVLTAAKRTNAAEGCVVPDACRSHSCPKTISYCVDVWEKYVCECIGGAGYVGPRCDSICQKWNPCQRNSVCRDNADSSHGYVCECDDNHSGQYCEQSIAEPCPATWWGYPICGPCNCPVDKGFNANCNKSTGECTCKDNYYRPPSSDTCFSCDCYQTGSYGGSCDITGQCKCRAGVIGKRCDRCASRFAQVTLRGCEVVYDSCPKSFMEGIWWERIPFDTQGEQDCPPGSVGKATRYCNSTIGWQAPNMLECLSKKFVDILDWVKKMETGKIKLTAYVSKLVIQKAALATSETEKMHGYDINVTYRLLRQVLAHEVNQTGLSLTHTQDRNFIHNLATTVGNVLDKQYKTAWQKINTDSSGSVLLMKALEDYMRVLLYNMPRLFMQPFDVANENLVFGMDYINKDNFTGTHIPKYNNKVPNPAMFDKDTKMFVPPGALRAKSLQDWLAETVGKPKTAATIGYVMYRWLGDLLPAAYEPSSVRGPGPGVPVSVNAPVFSVNIVDQNKTMKELREPIAVDFKQLENKNRSSPQCVYWQYAKSSEAKGYWSSEGCQLTDRREDGDKKYVTCECNHMTSFAILMDISNKEYTEPQALTMEVVTYAGLSVSLICLLVAFIAFCCLSRFKSNATSIHINLVLTIFIAHMVFLFGINRTKPEIACKLVAIILHYFFMCTFTWMFVEGLHLYRMMTEIRDINQGSMKFYYVLGYVVPGIIVGLAVGLSTDGYGNQQFCWLSTSDLLIWSFAGPICCIVALNLIVFLMAIRVSCQPTKEQETRDLGLVKSGLRIGLVLLPLLGVTWVFGLLAVNDNIVAFHYLFAIFNCFQGIFILLAHIVFSKRTRRDLKNAWLRCRGQKVPDDELNSTRNTLSRSALAYHHDSSLEGGLNRMNVGISTTSTTSRSTSKTSSGGLYRADGYLRSNCSTSTSGNVPSATDYLPHTGIPPYGYDSSMFHDKRIQEEGDVKHVYFEDDYSYSDTPSDQDAGERKRRKRRDSDSDSELSALENQHDLELASSHSSDDDDDDPYGPRWDQPKKPMDAYRLDQSPGRMLSQLPGYAPPPPYTRRGWQGENGTHTPMSDSEVRTPDQINIQENICASLEKIITPNGSRRGSKDQLSPPQRTDSLPPDLPPKPDFTHRKPESPSIGKRSPKSPNGRIAIKVLTHNGSISSESESPETTV